MKKLNLYYIAKNLLLTTLIAGVFLACENSASDDHDEHSEPEGFVLVMNGQEIVSQTPGGTLTGELELTPGEETDLITIYFLDVDGDRFQPEEDEYSLGFEFETAGIAEFEQHSEDGKWSFHIHAEAVGITDLTLMLMHNDHSDFSTQGIHVHVE